MAQRLVAVLMLCAAALAGHPMGNFSVNHYARIVPGPRGATIRYVLDLAEIPAFELFQQWGVDSQAPSEALHAKALEQARLWAASLIIAVDGKPAAAHVEKAELFLAEGAGNMKVLRIAADLGVDAAPGALTFEDRNYTARSGWKEIVIRQAEGASIVAPKPAGTDRSSELTAYPQDPMLAPPQDVKASFSWSAAPSWAAERPTKTIAPSATDPSARFTKTEFPSRAISISPFPVRLLFAGSYDRIPYSGT